MSVSAKEVAVACMILLDKTQKPPGRDYLAAMLEAQQATIERLEQEMEVVRRVIRTGDFAQDPRYHEARKALTKFDMRVRK